jgi:DedD protein
VREDGEVEPAPQIETLSAKVDDEVVSEPKEPAAPLVGKAVGAGVLTAWVVQAGSFGDEQNAIAVRDRLRRAGHPSFINASDDQSLFRVKVGPMTNQDQAKRTRDDVIELLGRDALVTAYP